MLWSMFLWPTSNSRFFRGFHLSVRIISRFQFLFKSSNIKWNISTAGIFFLLKVSCSRGRGNIAPIGVMAADVLDYTLAFPGIQILALNLRLVIGCQQFAYLLKVLHSFSLLMTQSLNGWPGHTPYVTEKSFVSSDFVFRTWLTLNLHSVTASTPRSVATITDWKKSSSVT